MCIDTSGHAWRVRAELDYVTLMMNKSDVKTSKKLAGRLGKTS